MPHVQYLGPSDELDMRALMGGEQFHFFARDGILGTPVQRGAAVEVTPEQMDELRTYPGHQFVDVTPPGEPPQPPVADPAHPENVPIT